jgi:hypothetical protein
MILNKPSLATVATSGSYSDLSNKPTIPAAQVNSDWNASGTVAEILNKPTIPAAQVQSDWTSVAGVSMILNKPSLATVATSGSYSDLSNKPSIPAAQVNSDWNASGTVAEILNKPTIPAAQVQSDWNAVAGMGVILNKPTIPADVSGKKYIIQTADAALPSAQALGVLDTGILKNTTSTGVLTVAAAGTDYLAPSAATATPTQNKIPIADGTGGVLSTGWLGSGSASSAVYLRGDGTWAAVVASAPLGNSRLTSADVTLSANYSVAVPGDYEIVSSYVLELSDNSIMELT